MTPKIDSHHHFWKYNAREYDWIDERMRAIRRDFLPNDLRAVLSEAGFDGALSVQARQTLEETDWLLEMAREHDFLRGVVGWVPLTDPHVARHLERLSAHKKLRAVRHVVQSEPDDNFILRADFNDGIRLLRRFRLRYDILIYEKHLPQTIRFVDRHPDQVFILDHIAKPRIRDHALSPWLENIRELARRQNVYCKVSGMVTEADWQTWTPADLSPYLETVLDAFGPARLMYGSDWPVMLVASSYRRWAETVGQAISRLSSEEQERFFGGTAIAAYGL